MRQFEREILRDILLSATFWLAVLVVLISGYVFAVGQLQ